MVTKRTSLSLAALVGIGLAVGSGARAQVITQTFSFPATTPPPQQTVPFTDNFTFTKFDSTLGVLSQVTIFLQTSITAEVDVFNSTAIPQAFTGANASIPITLTGPGPINMTATATAGPIAGTANPGFNAYSGNVANASQFTNVDMSLWIPNYEGVGFGTGSIVVSASGGSYSGNANPGVFFGGSATANGTVTLTYFYSGSGSIPEPGTVTFLAAGVLGSLSVVIRRRKRA